MKAVLRITAAIMIAAFLMVQGNTIRAALTESAPVGLTLAAGSSLLRVPALTSSEIMTETGIAALRGLGLSGKGVTVGIVDTGVDPQVMGAGSVVSWTDLTSEGIVNLSGPLSPGPDGFIESGGERFAVSRAKSASGLFRIGFWSKAALPESSPVLKVLKDLPRIGVLLADNYLPGQYDTVYIDTDADHDFSDEAGLELYRNSRSYVALHGGTLGSAVFTVLVADIRENGRQVVLGFDAHGHGTSVASVLAGRREGFQAISPSSSLVVVKAVNSGGEASWDAISRGISAACEQGANVVLLSATPLSSNTNTAGRDALDKILKQNRGVLLVVAAGNAGPGLGTLPPLGHYDNMLVTSGYVPASVSKSLGWGAADIFWPWSSTGPDQNGNLPDVAAPALAPVLLPAWAEDAGRGFAVLEGTSTSAAFAAGVASLLSTEASVSAGGFSPERVKRSLLDTAVTLPGTSAPAQGHGIIRADAALSLCMSIKTLSRTRAVFQWNGGFFADAFFDRNKVPGQVPLTIDNLSPFPLELLVTLPQWARIPYDRLGIAPVDQRQSLLTIGTSEPGLYSGFLEGDDLSSPGIDAEAAVTAIVPRELGAGTLGVESFLGPGEVHRELVRVPEGLEALEISFGVDVKDGHPRGRAQLYIYDNSGQAVYKGEWIGSGAEKSAQTVRVSLPSPGVWEVVVLSDPSLRSFGLDDTVFSLQSSSVGLRSVSETVRASKTDDGALSSQFLVSNSGDNFAAELGVLVDGVNGIVRRGESTVTSTRETTVTLPRVEQGAKTLYLRVSPAVDSMASLTSYLYFFDPTTGQWREIASANSSTSHPGEILITDPAPGQYVAYVGASGLGRGSSTFRWSALQIWRNDQTMIYEDSGKLSAFLWEKGRTVRIVTRVPLAAQNMGYQYALVWDTGSRSLKAMLPVVMSGAPTAPLVTVIPGGRGPEGVNLSVKAWERESMRPMGACVQVDGVWYQLSSGTANLILNRPNQATVTIRSEFPGTVPWTDTIILDSQPR